MSKEEYYFYDDQRIKKNGLFTACGFEIKQIDKTKQRLNRKRSESYEVNFFEPFIF